MTEQRICNTVRHIQYFNAASSPRLQPESLAQPQNCVNTHQQEQVCRKSPSSSVVAGGSALVDNLAEYACHGNDPQGYKTGKHFCG